MGFSKDKDVLPRVKPPNKITWDALLGEWRKTVHGLARDVVNGEADVDPKNGPKTCERCDLHPLCRVNEKLNLLEDNEEAGE